MFRKERKLRRYFFISRRAANEARTYCLRSHFRWANTLGLSVASILIWHWRCFFLIHGIIKTQLTPNTLITKDFSCPTCKIFTFVRKTLKNPVMTPKRIVKKTNLILAVLIFLHPLCREKSCSESPSVSSEQALGTHCLISFLRVILPFSAKSTCILQIIYMHVTRKHFSTTPTQDFSEGRKASVFYIFYTRKKAQPEVYCAVLSSKVLWLY